LSLRSSHIPHSYITNNLQLVTSLLASLIAASLISIDLAKNLLQRRGERGRIALVVSTEVITPNLYHGNERGFLLQNTLFRCGGAAMVLTNKLSYGTIAKYKLLNTVRVQGTGEVDYQCVYETQDKTGERGVTLSKVRARGKGLSEGSERNELSDAVPYNALISSLVTSLLAPILAPAGHCQGRRKVHGEEPHHPRALRAAP